MLSRLRQRALRSALFTAILIFTSALVYTVAAQKPGPKPPFLLIDTHNDLADKILSGSKTTMTDVPRLRQGGFGAVFFSAYVAGDYAKTPGASANRARQAIKVIKDQIIGKNADTFVFTTTAGGIEQANRAGKIAALIGVEGGHAIEDKLEMLDELFNAGARYMTLTHSNTNSWADSSGDIDKAEVKHHNGLTDFGKQVVKRMNDLGMMVDISHVADKTFWDALAVSRAPLIASHSSCRALSAHARNMTDEMIHALARKGGVMHVNFNCEFLSEDFRKKFVELKKSNPQAKETEIEPPPLSVLIDQIDHAVKVAGIDHVGIGSDFDGVECVPAGIEDVARFPAITAALREKGYKDSDLRKLYGANTLRVMRAVEQAAKH